jgi:hypothetical protein
MSEIEDSENISQLSDCDELDLIHNSEDETNQALAKGMAVIRTSIENMKRARSPEGV